MNSISQCLQYTECLDAYLQDVGNVKRCSHENVHVAAGFCALCAMQRHVRTAVQVPGTKIFGLKLTRYTFVIFSHRFHLWQEIPALAGSSSRNEGSHISCHCQKAEMMKAIFPLMLKSRKLQQGT
ncbi:unnamed protein product [Brassica rapa subsp. trilocularis]